MTTVRVGMCGPVPKAFNDCQLDVKGDGMIVYMLETGFFKMRKCGQFKHAMAGVRLRQEHQLEALRE